MKNIKINYSTLFFLIGILILSIILYKTYSSVDVYKDEIKSLNKEIEELRELSEVNNLTKEFIELSSSGQHGDLLTGTAKDEYDLALEEQGIDEDMHEEVSLNGYDLISVYVEETEENTAKSYAIYRAYFPNNPESNEITTQRILTLSLIAEWEKTNKGYKVYNYRIELLQDSLDQVLQELSNNDGE